MKNWTQNKIVLFGLAGLSWLLVAQGFCWFLSPTTQMAWMASEWMFYFWGLSLIDLFFLAKLMQVMVYGQRSKSKKNLKMSIEALCWGLIKISCMGLFILALLKGQKTPLYGLLLGLATLGVVPVLGGVLWSQRVLRHA